MNAGASQWAVTMSTARGTVAISRGIDWSDSSSGCQSIGMTSLIHGQGPPPWAIAYVGSAGVGDMETPVT